MTQSVLCKLADKMRGFAYDPARSFRAWLKLLTHHAWSDFLDGRRRAVPGSGDSAVVRQLESVEAREDLVASLGEEFDRELVAEAMLRVRLWVAPAKWEVFRLLAVEGLSGAEVARRQAMKVATVYVVRSKVQKMLQDEIRKLEAPATEEAP